MLRDDHGIDHEAVERRRRGYAADRVWLDEMPAADTEATDMINEGENDGAIDRNS